MDDVLEQLQGPDIISYTSRPFPGPRFCPTNPVSLVISVLGLLYVCPRRTKQSYTPSGHHCTGDDGQSTFRLVLLLLYAAIGGKIGMNLLSSFYLPRNQLTDGVCQQESVLTKKGEGEQRGTTPSMLFLSVYLLFRHSAGRREAASNPRPPEAAAPSHSVHAPLRAPQ